LHRLRVRLDLLEVVVLALVRGGALGPLLPQRLDPLFDHLAAVGMVDVGTDALELLTVGADADPDHQAAAAELVERRDLLGQQHRLAHGDDDDAGPQPDPFGRRSHKGQRHQRLVVVGGIGPFVFDVILRRQMVVAPD
jgi:hypothetical protein